MARSTRTDEPTPEATEAPTVVKPREAFDALTVPDDPAQAFVHQSISDAVDLLDAKLEVQARLQQSRDFLDYAVKSDQTNEEQRAWIAEYLPKRHRNQNGATADTPADDGGDTNNQE